MRNAHLRLGLLEYQRATEKISTRIRVRVDRYIGEDRKAHLLSAFGNDSDIGAITAAIHEKATFTLSFPDGTSKQVSLGENPSCYKGSVSLADRKHPVRHVVAASQELHANGGVGRTILMRYERDEAWATLVSFLGLPGDPKWADHVLGVLEREKRIKDIDGIGCRPILISATTEELLGLDWGRVTLQGAQLSGHKRSHRVAPVLPRRRAAVPVPADNAARIDRESSRLAFRQLYFVPRALARAPFWYSCSISSLPNPDFTR